MKKLIIIPARAGSVRLKKKNKKIFKKKPLVVHSIIFAKKLKITSHILISTNDEEIMDIGKKLKVLVPWKRPENISKNNSNSISFALHAIKWFEKNYGKLDVVILLQPTSPYRSIKTFNSMYKKFLKNKNSIVTVSNDLKRKKKILYSDKDFTRIVKKKDKNNFYLPVQIVGNLYINSVSNLRKYKKFTNKESIPFLIENKKEVTDIDTISDWKTAIKLK
ncbi:hypothetical protein OAS16_06560 [Candidatus Pelagibacter sp.]|nr:hypothetical protein [Candidatus Pelagibacter sp.]